MIRVEYINKEIKVFTEDISKLYNIPLKLVITKHISKEIVWTCELNDNSWAAFPNNEMHDVMIYEGDRVVYKRIWNVFLDGDVLYKSLYLYCERLTRNGIWPNGLAIGTHDGDFGEWVPAVLDNITHATLIEASLPQFKKLSENFRGQRNVKLINSLVTTDGSPTRFFEGGKGYTNSVVPRVITAWEKEPITSTVKESVAINDIIDQMDRFNWLHLDVEGYDATLIKAIDPKKLPLFILFENNNMLPHEKNDINDYLKEKGYFLREESVSTIAIKC